VGVEVRVGLDQSVDLLAVAMDEVEELVLAAEWGGSLLGGFGFAALLHLELVGLDLASLTQVGSIEVLVEPLNPPDVVRRSHRCVALV